MRFNQKKLHAALAKCASVADRKATLPALANVRIVGGELTSSDLMRTVVCRVDATGDDISCLVSAHDLLARVALLDGDVSMSEESSSLVVRSGSRRYVLRTAHVTEYPDVVMPSGEMVTIGGQTLRESIDGSIYAASSDTSRPQQCAVKWGHDDDGRMTMVGTDGHRLAHWRTNGAWPHSILVPRDSMASVRRFVDRAESVELGVSDDNLFARVAGDMISVKLSPERFPPWREIVETISPSQAASVDASCFASALAAVGVSAPEKMGRVVIRPDPGGIAIEASSPELGDARDVVPSDGTVPSEGWGCSAQYLYDAVRLLDGEVTIETGGSLDPMVVRHNGEIVAVVMPVRM